MPFKIRGEVEAGGRHAKNPGAMGEPLLIVDGCREGGSCNREEKFLITFLIKEKLNFHPFISSRRGRKI